MDTEHSMLTATDGTEIFYYKKIPENMKAVVLLLHGYAFHYDQMKELIEVLPDEGYGVYAYDHRGHGRSIAEKGHIESFEYFVDDMKAIINMIRINHRGVPIYTIGHSMGGLIAFLYGVLYSDDIAGQIFTGPALGPPWGTNLIPNFLFEIINTCIKKFKIYAIFKRPSSRNPKFRKTVDSDPKCLIYSTVGFFYQFIQIGIKKAMNLTHKYHLPCLIIHGKQDKIIPYSHSINIYNKIPSEDKTLKLYDNMYHELLFEPEREQVINDVIDWLNKQTSHA